MQAIDQTLEETRITKADHPGGIIYQGAASELLRLAAMSGLDRKRCNENGTSYRFYLDGKQVGAMVDSGLFIFAFA